MGNQEKSLELKQQEALSKACVESMTAIVEGRNTAALLLTERSDKSGKIELSFISANMDEHDCFLYLTFIDKAIRAKKQSIVSSVLERDGVNAAASVLAYTEKTMASTEQSILTSHARTTEIQGDGKKV